MVKKEDKSDICLLLFKERNPFASHRKNIMVQDTYKWVLQIYFICSTFAANKKNTSMARKQKKDKSFCRKFICRCINFKLVHLFL